MDLWTNEYIRQNVETLLVPFFIAFFTTLLITPLIGRLAMVIGAVDLPSFMRKKDDTTSASRINSEPKLKLGGLGIISGLAISVLIVGAFSNLNTGIVVGLCVITLFAFLDDKFDLPGKAQIIGQVLAAMSVVVFGISVTKISLLDVYFNFEWLSYSINLGDFNYIFNFPGDILTVFWIVGIINVVNWVGGIDDLNTSITGIIAFTMMLFALQTGNIALAVIIAAYVGALTGYFPYNYNPSKIIQGSTGDLVNGYLLAVFAIVGGTKWTSTFILLALPIIDGLIVVFLRFKSHPEVRKNPLKLLSISDTNHLHHRLLEVGYTRKTVLLIEVAIMTVISAIAIYFSGIRRDFVAFFFALSVLIVVFAIIFFVKKRMEKEKKLSSYLERFDQKPEAVVKVIIDNEEEKEEKFIY